MTYSRGALAVPVPASRFQASESVTEARSDRPLLGWPSTQPWTSLRPAAPRSIRLALAGQAEVDCPIGMKP